MIVVADTSPLRYLVVIEHDFLLPKLFGRVLIPPAVADELNHESTPKVVRAWLWGPRLRVIGTLRVLADGASAGFCNLEFAFERLRQTNFRVKSELFETLLDEYRRGKNE